jgi:hypothetical protein
MEYHPLVEHSMEEDTAETESPYYTKHTDWESSKKCNVICSCILVLLPLGLLFLIRYINDEAIFERGCNIRMDILIMVLAAMITALLLYLTAVRVIPLRQMLKWQLPNAANTLVSAIMPYTVIQLVAMIAYQKQCGKDTSTLLLVIYWIIVLVSSIPVVCLGLIALILLIITYFKPSFIPMLTHVARERKRLRAMHMAIRSYFTDPIDSEMPHKAYLRIYAEGDLSGGKYYGSSLDSAELILTSLYHSKIFRDVPKNHDETDDIQENNINPDNDDQDNLVEGQQKKSKPQIKSNQCGLCYYDIFDIEHVILTPCCDHAYHRACYFKYCIINSECNVCGCEIQPCLFDKLNNIDGVNK